MIAIDAGDTLAVAGTRSAEGRIATATRMVALVADRTAARHTLARVGVITICVGHTAHAFRSVGSVGAEGGVTFAAGVGGHITSHAGLVNALITIAIGVAITLDTPAAVG